MHPVNILQPEEARRIERGHIVAHLQHRANVRRNLAIAGLMVANAAIATAILYALSRL